MCAMNEAHSIAVIVAHPDDDAYGCAGSIALHEHDPGFRFVLVLATDGAAGQISRGVPATPATLGAWRRVESANAWRAHGTVPARHEWLGYADGHVAEADFEELVARLQSILEVERPQVVATFGPDGITGHRDHITIGRAADEAFHRARCVPGPGLRRLVHGAIRASVFERWNTARRRAGAEAWDPGREYHLRPVPDEAIDIEVDTSAVCSRIVAGLLEHRSQREVLIEPGASVRRWERMVSREPAVMAWPPRAAGQPVLADLFEGL
jgi:LmbE family N-acetylglucosaminyl deacetylase